ncbi:hypothetical protein RDWZM_010254 [Blomia tropicalis]|uniref:Peroxidase n=1 Tax=Blomia tropicalis TaxID=40697 RepID=A0A9Q0RII1_BLOTA|nr:hypothetical protein RDWZM_010254 [Blomia tropicalis]
MIDVVESFRPPMPLPPSPISPPISVATVLEPTVESSPLSAGLEHHPEATLYLHSGLNDGGGEHQSQSHYNHHHHGSYGFAVAPGVLSDGGEHGFDYRREYSPNLASIYSRYLNRPTDDMHHCPSSGMGEDVGWLDGDRPDMGLDGHDFDSGFAYAARRIEEYERSNQQYLASDPRGLNFSAHVYVATLHAKYNELVTRHIKKSKCLTRAQVAVQLPTNTIPPNPWKKKKYCELESPITLTTHCEPNEPYRRLDGKCNNPIHTNLGSSFHCHRRLMPPDYSDGIHEIRTGVDGRPLPSPRLVTQLMMPDIDLNDPHLSAFHFAWGQFLVHDTYRTIQFLGLAIDCCRMINRPRPPMPGQLPIRDHNRGTMRHQPPVPHPECLPITNFPPNQATEMLQQICLNTVRSITCNTCSLGPRNQMNAATQVIDLSNVYGGNMLNNSELLRSYIGGQMLMQLDKHGHMLLPTASLPADTDTLDLTPCNPPLNNPLGVGCFRTGDGIRGNQNPFIASIQTLMARRHNQHAAGLVAANPHWDDERLFQEARRLLIAEVQMIHYAEYVPLLLGERLMKYFHLNVRMGGGYTKYNPHVEPSTIHAAGVSALRIGHSQTRSTYRMINDQHYGGTTTFQLKDRFFNMIDVWQGRITPLLRGILADPSKNIDPYGVIDLKDFLFFNVRRPSVVDLLSININRGRDHGVPAYVYNLQYCTGAEIKSWKDLERFMPPSKIKNLRKVYRHFRDIDVYLGGLLEYHLKGARVGPTFACLIGIQFYHWKYGDRFYFEHGGEAGSFTPEQLNTIRAKSSLANLLCKASDIEMVQIRPLEEAGPHNPKISCDGLPEIEYFAFRELGEHVDSGYLKSKKK